jgi:hypothetical protein
VSVHLRGDLLAYAALALIAAAEHGLTVMTVH